MLLVKLPWERLSHVHLSSQDPSANGVMTLSGFPLGKQWVYWASLQRLWEGILTGVWAILLQSATPASLTQHWRWLPHYHIDGAPFQCSRSLFSNFSLPPAGSSWISRQESRALFYLSMQGCKPWTSRAGMILSRTLADGWGLTQRTVAYDK